MRRYVYALLFALTRTLVLDAFPPPPSSSRATKLGLGLGFRLGLPQLLLFLLLPKSSWLITDAPPRTSMAAHLSTTTPTNPPSTKSALFMKHPNQITASCRLLLCACEALPQVPATSMVPTKSLTRLASDAQPSAMLSFEKRSSCLANSPISTIASP